MLLPKMVLHIRDMTIGAVTRLQRHFVKLGLGKPLYIGCQHHIMFMMQY